MYKIKYRNYDQQGGIRLYEEDWLNTTCRDNNWELVCATQVATNGPFDVTYKYYFRVKEPKHD